VFKVAAFRFDVKREDEFASARLPCQSLAGQVCPMQTQCTHTVFTR